MTARVPAVASTARIIERIAADWPEPVSPRVLVSELNMNRSTCYNILATLQDAGWVRSLGDRAGWTLGPRLLTLTGVTDDVASAIVREEIDQSARRLGFVVFAAEPDGSGGYVVVARAEHRRGIRVTVGVGEYFQFSAPALMYAFHSWSDPETFSDEIARVGVNAFTPNTLTERAAILAEAEQTRGRGFSVSLQQYDVAQSGVAAPVFDRHGQVAMVLCCLAFSSELRRDNVEAVGRLLAAGGLRVTERLGGRVPGEPTETGHKGSLQSIHEQQDAAPA
ncbi:IclR family transcriptional regulator [Streptomyces sp. NPDC101776]|uniref:IclR family transcriptional regulator n=1 Tax=Streptomyces sp. NPDC101776 TaxID=3366146 RepID=UPI0038160E1C